MIPRLLSDKILETQQYFPITFVGGPRQAGKTTLVKNLFSQLPYANLELPDVRLFAEEDPRRFLETFPKGAVLDEVQRVPALFSYLQGLVDEHPHLRFLLTGSQNYLMMEHLTQSLAGRVGLHTLLPFGFEELPPAMRAGLTAEAWALKGAYPPIFDRNIPSEFFYQNYLQTYLERDVRQLVNVSDFVRFSNFVKLCAGRAGQVLKLSDLARDADIAVNTAKAWLSILETSYIVFRLPPYFTNINKRLIKSPKLYFTDTGVLCHLLGISTEEQLHTHYLYGNIMENMLLIELYKRHTHRGKPHHFYYLRDSNGNEIDLVVDNGTSLKLIELKSTRTFNTRLFSGLSKWKKVERFSKTAAMVIYLGEQSFSTEYGALVPWTRALAEELVTTPAH